MLCGRDDPARERVTCVARQGIARALLEEGIERLRREGVEQCHLEVRINNPAILLYEALGFAKTGLRRRYYQDGTDALVMSRSLSQP